MLHLSIFAGINKSNVCRVIAKIEYILLESSVLKLQGADVLAEAGADLFLYIDATEIRIRRSIEGQLKSFSGKKWTHTHKFQIIMGESTGEIFEVTDTYGKDHDFNLFKQNMANYSREACFVGDAGYEGLTNEFPNSFTPFKNTNNTKISAFQSVCNQHFAQKRIKIEHKIRSIKIFQIFSNTYRSSVKRLKQQFMLIAGIVNLEVSLKNFNT
jgi:hypothetical protein